MGEVQSLVLTTLENQRDLLIGVDVDEQMTLLIEQQQAYSAAAKVITMVRENLTTLMSIID
jgi:flagellar hook-associated protein 1 FlgK